MMAEFDHDTVLFGRDATERIVAAEFVGHHIRLFISDEAGTRLKDDPFHPFILLESSRIMDGFTGYVTFRDLQGEGVFKCVAFFRSWHDCLDARKHLMSRTGRSPSAPDVPYLWLGDPVHQHLLLTGKTLFKGMEFDGLRRLAIDIETSCGHGFEFSNPEREEDRIVSLAVMDEQGFSEVLSARDLTEAQMIRRLTSIIHERDPDVIEGHNVFCFDLEYLRIRAGLHGLRLSWGRDGSEPRINHSRFTVGERAIDYPRWNIFGRHVVDTYFLLQLYDVSARDLESYGLKAAAVHFGLAAPDRTYIDRGKIAELHRADPEMLSRYNLDDVRETLALSRLLSYPFFLQTRIFPYSYQSCIVRGNATKINALFLREYLRQHTAIPRAQPGPSFEGGHTDILQEGVIQRIVHCDVASLYPSLILVHRLQPAQDSLGLFLPLVRGLRLFRLDAKARARAAVDAAEREYYNALQQTFKVLINSFYGYLGSPLHNFADPAVAAQVTALGRETIGEMLRWLEERQARPVEVDTDGVYFVPPSSVTSAADEEAFIGELSRALPPGLDVEMAGRYRAMFSYKMKNYALFGYDGRLTIRGSALKSRGMEKYLRAFTEELIMLLLQGEGTGVDHLFEEYEEKLRRHRFPVEWLAKTETLGESPAAYRDKLQLRKRNPSAAFETALKSPLHYRAGDQISFYIAGWGKDVAAHEVCRPVWAYDPGKPDENIPYYLNKLLHVKNKFSRFLPAERTLFD